LGFQPGGKNLEATKTRLNVSGFAMWMLFPGGKMPPSTAGREARRYF
jgi:hypothetical protein